MRCEVCKKESVRVRERVFGCVSDTVSIIWGDTVLLTTQECTVN